jgi:asparagine synthase (glutamine-hydrolysing)
LNLFLLGWRLSPELRSRAEALLAQTASVYPQLDPATLWHEERGFAFAASIHTAERAAGARRYVHRDANQVVLYDGSLVERAGRFAAHDASALASHWDQVRELEGQFVAARLQVDPPAMELVSDWLGFHQTYYHRSGDTWVASNNVRLVRRLMGLNALDPSGVSLMLTTGWVGGDRTLEREIQVVPAAQHWIWDAHRPEPRQTTYYPWERLAAMKHRRRRPSFQRLGEEMVETCRSFARAYGRLRCPLTGGRDTRLLAALLVNGQIDAEYYSSGAPGSPDVTVARRIADHYRLPLEVQLHPSDAVIQAWESAATKLIQQNDGLVNLVQIADLVHQPQEVERLSLSLWGIGGEIARGNYYSFRILLFDRRLATIRENLADLLADSHGGLIRPEGLDRTRDFVLDFAAQATDDGFEPLDIGDLFFTWDRVRRWAGSNERKAMPAGDRYSPFVSRSFVEAAFSMSPVARMTAPSHFHLIKLLAPDLHRLPFGTGTWRSQWPPLNLWRRSFHAAAEKVKRGNRNKVPPARSDGLGFDLAIWLEAKLPWLRAMCLDQPASPIWEFVDRDVFERMTGKESSLPARRQIIRGLYNVGTVFAYVENR